MGRKNFAFSWLIIFYFSTLLLLTLQGCSKNNNGSSSGLSSNTVNCSDGDLSYNNGRSYYHGDENLDPPAPGGSLDHGNVNLDPPVPEPMTAEEQAEYDRHYADWKTRWDAEGGFAGHHPNWGKTDYHSNDSESFHLTDSEYRDVPPPAPEYSDADKQAYRDHDQSYEEWRREWHNGGSKAYHDKWYRDNADIVESWEAEHRQLAGQKDAGGRSDHNTSSRRLNNDCANQKPSPVSVQKAEQQSATQDKRTSSLLSDADGDGVSDSNDRCSQTPTGARVWKYGSWTGCAEGERKDR